MWSVRRLMLFAVVLGVMVVSINGQIQATQPLLGEHLAALFAVTLDMASLIALNEVLSADRGPVRRWGWLALALAAGLSVGLNVWHAVNSGTLPLPAAIAVGAGPVALTGVLSHLLALSLAAEKAEAVPTEPARGTDGGTGSGWHQTPPVPGTAGTGPTRPVPPAGTSPTGTNIGTSPSGTGVAAARDVPPPVPVVRAVTTGGARPVSGTRRPVARKELASRTSTAAGPARKTGTPTPVEGLPPAAAALWDKARDLDIRHRAAHGEAAPRRLLMETFRIGTSTAAPLHRALAVAAETTRTTTGEAPVPATSTTVVGNATGTDTRPEDTGTTTGTSATGTAAGAGTDMNHENTGTSRTRLELVTGTETDATSKDEPAGTTTGTNTADVAEATEAAGGLR